MIAMQLISQSSMAILEAHHPEAAAELGRLSHLLDQSVIPLEILQLCQGCLLAGINGQAPPSPKHPSALELACLHLCEQFRASVSGVSDRQIQALLAHLSADDTYNLCSAIYLIEMSHKLDRTLQAVLS